MRRFLALALLATLLLPACGDDENRTGSDADSSASAYGPTKPAVTIPDGQPPKTLKIRDIEIGSGPAAKAGDRLSMHYVGVSWSTKKEFDASYGKEPISLVLGSGMVIPGWDQGLVGMKLGGRRELTIPPELAYGSDGRPPVIAPNETLVFIVDLVQLTSV